jgi:hypothetical protein
MCRGTIFETIIQTREGEEQTITLLAAKLNRSYISLIGIHITTTGDGMTIFITQTKQVILSGKFHGKLAVGRKIHTDHIGSISIAAYCNRVAKALAKIQIITVRMVS